MKNDGFSLFSRLPSFGWEVLHPPPRVMCEDMHNQYLRSRAQLGGWPNSLGTRENSIMVRHHGRASSARSRKVSRGHGYLPRAGKRVAAAQPDKMSLRNTQTIYYPLITSISSLLPTHSYLIRNSILNIERSTATRPFRKAGCGGRPHGPVPTRPRGENGSIAPDPRRVSAQRTKATRN